MLRIAMLRAAMLTAACAAASAQTDGTIRVSSTSTGAAGNGECYGAVVSADGSSIAFMSQASDLVGGDTNNYADVFVFDRSTGGLSRVSVDSQGNEAHGNCGTPPALSSDGRFVAFSSDADDLATDPNGRVEDVFVHDRGTGVTSLVSIDHAGVGGDHLSTQPSIDDAGEKVAFMSLANNLVFPELTGNIPQVYVRDMTLGVTTLASSNAAGRAGNQASAGAVISKDGKKVAFTTNATNLPNSGSDEFQAKCYVKNLVSGGVERVDIDSSGGYSDGNSVPLGLSFDGALVLMWSDSALVPEDQNDAYDYYLRDRNAGTTERVSVATGGAEIHPYSKSLFVSGRMSSDGRFVMFTSDAPDVVEGHRNGQYDVFVRDRSTSVTSLASLGTLDELGQGDSYAGGISDDGSVVSFSSRAIEFAPDDTNNVLDVFVRERSMIPASWVHYGTGFPGRNGTIPTITPDVNPWRGTAIDFGISCSSSTYTVALLLIGGPRDSIPTGLGGTLLLDLALAVPMALSPYGGLLSAQVPMDYWANGLVVDLQVIELDPWATKGVSFSDGLELTIGDG